MANPKVTLNDIRQAAAKAKILGDVLETHHSEDAYPWSVYVPVKRNAWLKVESESRQSARKIMCDVLAGMAK